MSESEQTKRLRALVANLDEDAAKAARAWTAATKLIEELVEFCVENDIEDLSPEVKAALAEYGTACVETGSLSPSAWAALMEDLER